MQKSINDILNGAIINGTYGFWENIIIDNKEYHGHIDVDLDNSVKTLTIWPATEHLCPFDQNPNATRIIEPIPKMPHGNISNQLIEKEKELQGVYARLNQLEVDRDTSERKGKAFDIWKEEKTLRHKSQLQVIFYMLDQLQKVGTHREKEVVIRYMRMIIHGFINTDGLSQYNNGYDDMPF